MIKLYSRAETFAIEYAKIFDARQGSNDNAHPEVRQEELTQHSVKKIAQARNMFPFASITA